MMPTVGRIVHYKLSLDDVAHIRTQRHHRTDAGGTPVTVGDVVPLIITRVNQDEFGSGVHGINGRVMLDGPDSMWLKSLVDGEDPGEWMWPPRA